MDVEAKEPGQRQSAGSRGKGVDDTDAKCPDQAAGTRKAHGEGADGDAGSESQAEQQQCRQRDPRRRSDSGNCDVKELETQPGEASGGIGEG